MISKKKKKVNTCLATGFGLENDTKRAANEVMTFFFFFIYFGDQLYFSLFFCICNFASTIKSVVLKRPGFSLQKYGKSTYNKHIKNQFMTLVTICRLKLLVVKQCCDLAQFLLLSRFILYSRESELYHCTLDGISALARELPF